MKKDCNQKKKFANKENYNSNIEFVIENEIYVSMKFGERRVHSKRKQTSDSEGVL